MTDDGAINMYIKHITHHRASMAAYLCALSAQISLLKWKKAHILMSCTQGMSIPRFS